LAFIAKHNRGIIPEGIVDFREDLFQLTIIDVLVVLHLGQTLVNINLATDACNLPEPIGGPYQLRDLPARYNPASRLAPAPHTGQPNAEVVTSAGMSPV
jgi:hypothetical protein